MPPYTPPVNHMLFLLDEVVGFDRLTNMDRFAEVTPDLTEAILAEAGKFASEVIAPLAQTGDRTGARLTDGTVQSPPGYADAYRKFVEAGWNSISGDPDFGGQGLPKPLQYALMEMISAADLAFSLCPLLTPAGVEALSIHGNQDQKDRYLRQLVSGEWPATMLLTEPQAGSDVGALKTRAVKAEDGTYRLTGQKIFITWGEHDMAENIIHMVLARTPDAPAGTKGISLFVVPKFLVNDDGSLGQRNDVRCVSLEEKLGIHASPTCVMSLGDTGDCVGYLVGEECQGMRYMFTMMNNARLTVGIQGVGIAEHAYQKALAYARERVQGRPIGHPEGGPIIHHPDVRRMLLHMKALTEGARAITFAASMAVDLAHNAEDGEERQRQAGMAGLLTPIAKAVGSETGVAVSSLAIQVHGGAGYIEETGVAQHYRDSRISPIYEGTNGIQAMDLAFRKVAADGGTVMRAFIVEMEDVANSLAEAERLAPLKAPLAEALGALKEVTDWVVENADSNPRTVAAAGTPYLRLVALTTAAGLLARGARAALSKGQEVPEKGAFYEARIGVAQYFINQILPETGALRAQVLEGDGSVFALDPDQLGL